MAERLGTTIQVVTETKETDDRLIVAIEALNRPSSGPDQRLEPLVIHLDEEQEQEQEQLRPNAAVIDPEKPLPTDELVDLLIEQEHRRTVSASHGSGCLSPWR